MILHNHNLALAVDMVFKHKHKTFAFLTWHYYWPNVVNLLLHLWTKPWAH